MLPPVTAGVVKDGPPVQEPPPVIVGFVIAGAVKVLLLIVCVSVVPMIAPTGAARPPWNCALRLLTIVGLAMEKGAVPTVTVETICCEKV